MQWYAEVVAIQGDRWDRIQPGTREGKREIAACLSPIADDPLGLPSPPPPPPPISNSAIEMDWLQPFAFFLLFCSILKFLCLGECPLPRLDYVLAFWLIVQLVKNPPAMQETLVRFLGREDPLEKG